MKHVGSVLLLIITVSVAHAFNCNDYGAGSADSNFCVNTACQSYCATHNLPEYCMDVHFVSLGLCSQHSGFPSLECSSAVTSVAPEHRWWCQTVACGYAQTKCKGTGATDCDNRIREFVDLDFSRYCRPLGSDPTPEPETTRYPSFLSSSTPKPVAPSTPKPTTTENPAEVGGCWSPGGWGGQPCMLCAAPSGGACPEFQWTPCYNSKSQCQLMSGGGDNCGKKCPVNTKSLKRPEFRGASCYTSAYGSQFGPNWAPSGKTRFEQLVPSSTELHSLVQTLSDDYPLLNKQWGSLSGCDAATAVYENIVCALEVIEATGRKFEGPPGGALGYTIKDFLNSGDETADKRELAAFLSHKFKETARLTAWEEASGGPGSYADCSNEQYPCGANPDYHGRGPVQISWNYNYGAFSEWFFDDKMVLLNDPDLVDPEGPMGFIAAFWFWMTPRQFTSGAPVAGNLRCRDGIVHWGDGKINAMYADGVDYDSVSGLGLTTNVINGGIECNTGDLSSSMWRVGYYLTLASRLGVGIPEASDPVACANSPICRGLIDGCRPKSKNFNLRCTSSNSACGELYLEGWQRPTCSISPA